MLTTTANRLMRRMFHSLYAILCLARIETPAAIFAPVKSRKSGTLRASKESSQLATKRTVADRLPKDTWDGHMHVIDPKRYPLAPGAVYVPSTNSVWDAVSFENTVGMKNIV